MMDNEKKQQVSQLACEMLGPAMDSIAEHGVHWETAVFSAMLAAKMLGTMALEGGMPLPGLKCDLAGIAALEDKLRETLEEALQVTTIAHRVESQEELEAFVERAEGAGARTTH